MNYRLMLIRHGKTVLANKGVYYGFTDVALSEEGINELISNNKTGLYPDADLYFTSGLSRANNTLNIIKGNVNYSVVESLKEYNFGDFELHTHDELINNQAYIAWMEDETGKVCCVNGESRYEFVNRMDSGIKQLFDAAAKSNAHSILTITHGGIISNFIMNYCDKSLTYYEAMPECGHGVDALMDYDGDSFKVIDIKLI